MLVVIAGASMILAVSALAANQYDIGFCFAALSGSVFVIDYALGLVFRWTEPARRHKHYTNLALKREAGRRAAHNRNH